MRYLHSCIAAIAIAGAPTTCHISFTQIDETPDFINLEGFFPPQNTFLKLLNIRSYYLPGQQ